MFELFLDLDGVLCDLEHSFFVLTGKHFGERDRLTLWSIVAKHPEVWVNSPLMPDAIKLWNYTKQYNPTILSGTPAGTLGDTASRGKRMWVSKHLGPDVKVITILVPLKHMYATETSILVDDRKKTIDRWKKAGGIGIFHTSVDDTIKQLQQIL